VVEKERAPVLKLKDLTRAFVQSLRMVPADPVFHVVSTVAVVAVSALVVKWQSKGGRATMG
jgi:hypothetical protein